MKILFNQFVDFMSEREDASVKLPSSALAALGVPPLDASSFGRNPQVPSPLLTPVCCIRGGAVADPFPSLASLRESTRSPVALHPTILI